MHRFYGLVLLGSIAAFATPVSSAHAQIFMAQAGFGMPVMAAPMAYGYPAAYGYGYGYGYAPTYAVAAPTYALATPAYAAYAPAYVPSYAPTYPAAAPMAAASVVVGQPFVPVTAGVLGPRSRLGW